MKVYVNKISGIDDAIVSLFMSRRSWSRGLEIKIRNTCDYVLNKDGSIRDEVQGTPEYKQFQEWINLLVKWGTKHITLLRFIDFSVTVEGLHRAGQDDWDAHAMRFDNRIIRNSTRMKGSEFGYELSSWYENKIIPTDIALQYMNIDIPDTIEYEGQTYIKTINGYILKGMENVQDVKRGLYMLSIPSNFIFKINLTEWSHVFKERNINGAANPEVKECCESIASQLENFHKQFNRELFINVKN